MGGERMETECKGRSLEILALKRSAGSQGQEGTWDPGTLLTHCGSYTVWMPRGHREEEVGVFSGSKGHWRYSSLRPHKWGTEMLFLPVRGYTTAH